MAHPPAFVLVVGLSSFAVGFCCIVGPAMAIIVLSRHSGSGAVRALHSSTSHLVVWLVPSSQGGRWMIKT